MRYFSLLRKASIILSLLTITFVDFTCAQVAPARKRSPRNQSASPNPQITTILREIDAARIENSIRTLVSFGTRNSLSTQDDPKRGIGAARDWLFQEFKKLEPLSGGRLVVEQQSYIQPVAQRILQPTKITNIVATLKGMQGQSADRVYIVSGHYDSMCGSPTNSTCDAPGANDDASGTAAVLEMVRVFASRKFDATIIFMAVAGEEQGLLGATHFAEEAKKSGMNIQAMLDNDIIGNTLGGNGVRDRKTIRLFSEGVPSNESAQEATLRRSIGGENDSSSRQLARFIKETSEKYLPSMTVQMIYRRDRYLRGGDHIPFLERGFSAVRFTEPNEDYRHQHQNLRTENGIVYGDLPEFVDFKYVAQVARVNAASLAMLALAPASPAETRLLTRQLTNDTSLEWKENSEPDLAGYEIVWRETTSPVWTHTQKIGRVTSYTLKGISKDNFFFGVRAYDKDGNTSPVSYPKPARQPAQ